MSSLYCSPLRVYVCLGLLAVVGVFSGLNLSVSMFPQSSQPVIAVQMPYAQLAPEEFAKVYGSLIESRLNSLSDNDVKVAFLETSYLEDVAQFKVTFDWGTEQKRALKEVETLIYGLSGQFPKEIRDRTRVMSWSDNQGFLAISFYSSHRNIDDLYDLIEPTLTPKLAQISGAENASLWNPNQKEVRIELIPETMAALQVLPRDVAQAIDLATNAQNGGSLLVNTANLQIRMPRQALHLDDLKKIPILSHTGRAIHLQDVAKVDLEVSSSHSRSFKTSGTPSLILFATPVMGGNIKEMAEQILQVVEDLKPNWPADVQMKVLVDPSEFIRNSIRNVFHEVVLAASLAVFILFLFVGNLRNVATAAIEIPLSIVLAFILMRLTGININLISLGGLALSAGMNVDASVVVMENIFRHFEQYRGPLTYQDRWRIVGEAVKEVRLPVIASTVASVVVFLPLAFTSALSYSLLGDLAKTVVFSHGFSAIVALILVPTIRLQLMNHTPQESTRSPLEGILKRLEKAYILSLAFFLRKWKWQVGVYLTLSVMLLLLIGVVLPRLPKEIIGMPDTDWMVIAVNTQGNSHLRQMEDQASEVENRLLNRFGEGISYTFTQVQGPNQASILARLKDKSQMQEAWKSYEEYFQNNSLLQYFVVPWNPSELPIPDPPHFQASIQGGTPRERLEVAHEVHQILEKHQLFNRTWQKPTYVKGENLVIRPHFDQWASLMASGAFITPFDLVDISRIATQGRILGQWILDHRSYNMSLYYPLGTVDTAEDLRSFPLGIKNKLIPLSALAQVDFEGGDPPSLRKDQQDIVLVNGKQDKRAESSAKKSVLQATTILKDWIQQNRHELGKVSIQFEDAQYELNDALHQLIWAVAISVGLVFVTMIIQLGDITSSLLVLVAIPLGFIGVISSLFLFNSTLSLNSALGVILLNGIAVANSVILVDFFNHLMKSGQGIVEAALGAAKARLRPILMTSLTTTIGMLPIAFGLGDGGRVLQPLGIAVSGGLWISMLFTLYLVPALQVTYWRWKKGRQWRSISLSANRPVDLVQ